MGRTSGAAAPRQGDGSLRRAVGEVNGQFVLAHPHFRVRDTVRAESPEGTDLEAAWERIAIDAPEYVGYRSKTDREIPVIRLRAVDEAPTHG